MGVGIRSGRGRTTAIIFIVLLLGYYQRWVYVPILEALSGRLSLDPANVPNLLEIHDELELMRKGGLSNSEIVSKESGRNSKVIADPLVQEAAKNLSQLIQRRLEQNQRGQNLRIISRGCKLPKVFCGPPVDCGLGCQIHYIMTCVMVASFTNRTLLVDWSNWPYQETSWTDLFLPIGVTDCPIDNDTASVIWSENGLNVTYPEMKSFPYKIGFPVSYDIGNALKDFPTIHMLWWNGQFAKFVVRYQFGEEELLKKLKTALKLYLPTVGILMRKRDRLSERKGKSGPQPIDKYMMAARKYFTKLEELVPSTTRRVFFATDDRNIIKLVRRRYRRPKWEIIGLQLKTEVEDMVKDLYLLSQCDFVVCSFNTDICRLVAELKEAEALRSMEDRVKSLDQRYLQALPHFKKIKFLQEVIY